MGEDDFYAVRIAAWRESFRRCDQHEPPPGVPLPRWRSFLKDASAFLGSPWVREALRLGWDEWQLFACSRTAPWPRLDMLGAIWFLHGASISRLTEDSMVMAHLTFRLPLAPADPEELALPWEFYPGS